MRSKTGMEKQMINGKDFIGFAKNLLLSIPGFRCWISLFPMVMQDLFYSFF